MICPNCGAEHGHYMSIEDFNPGSEPEWSYYEAWVCHICWHAMYSYEDGYIYEDEQ